jgi:hypothetical protein
MRIGIHISSLLFNYDCVIIPGLGGFVSNHTAASIQPEKQLAFPPSKGIIFNKNLISNDGLLADYISRSEEISYVEAQTQIQQFVIECRNKLAKGERIVFEELGILYFDAEKNIQFQPDFSVNFLTASFGLSPVVAQVIRTVQQPAEEAVLIAMTSEGTNENVISIDRNKKNNFRKYWPAAAAILLPIVFYSVWIPLGTDVLKTGHLEMSDLNPFHTKTAIRFEPRKNTFSYSGPEDVSYEWNELIASSGGPVAKLSLSNDSHLNVYVLPHEAETTNVAVNISNGGFHHHIISGCFRELSNAEAMVKDLQSKGYSDARILDVQNGLHRVAFASFADKSEATAKLSEIRRGDQPSAWLLEK